MCLVTEVHGERHQEDALLLKESVRRVAGGIDHDGRVLQREAGHSALAKIG